MSMCRMKLKADGKPYPRSGCAVCGPIIHKGWKCAEGHGEEKDQTMAMKPSKVEYQIGKDRYGRPSRLIGEVEGGQQFWSIISDPIAQRDEGEHIRSLTTEQLKSIAQILS
jgi:hypothetical protein